MPKKDYFALIHYSCPLFLAKSYRSGGVVHRSVDVPLRLRLELRISPDRHKKYETIEKVLTCVSVREVVLHVSVREVVLHVSVREVVRFACHSAADMLVLANERVHNRKKRRRAKA